jgi:hypothetical protein
MDWVALGKLAGGNGPLVTLLLGIIGLQWGIIWKLLNRFFAQQDLTIQSLRVADRTTQVAEKAVSEK